MKKDIPILLFDGDCEFCNFWIQFIKRHSSKAEFRFYPLQSEKGKLLIEEYKIRKEIDSIIVIKNDQVFIKSNAALQIIKSIGGIWNVFLVFWIVPRPIRDWIYDLIAKNRHRFIKSKSCETHQK